MIKKKKNLTATRRVRSCDRTLPWYPRSIHTVNDEKQKKTSYKSTREVYTDMCTHFKVPMSMYIPSLNLILD